MRKESGRNPSTMHPQPVARLAFFCSARGPEPPGLDECLMLVGRPAASLGSQHTELKAQDHQGLDGESGDHAWLHAETLTKESS